VVIPTHFRTQAADGSACEIVTVDDFLGLMDGMKVRRVNSDTITINSADLPQNEPVIQVLNYNF
jgi:hypothetical protein